MSTTYRGNCNFRETPGAVIASDSFGIDNIRRIYIGRTDNEAAFLRTFRRHMPDTEYPTLTFTDLNATRDGAFTTVEARFAGLLNGEIPEPVFAYGTSLVETQLTAIDGRVTSLEYAAPSMTVSYISRDVPRKLRHRGRLARTAEGFKILGARGAVTDEFLNATAARDATSTAALIAANSTANDTFTGFLYDIEIVPTAWDVNQVGLLWQVRETNEGRIVQHQVDAVKVDFEPGIFDTSRTLYSAA